jgi:glycosyltransferase involved in cell wall biosynthesis
MRVLFCGSHPDNCNGYSRVVHAMARGLALDHGVQVILFGFSRLRPIEDRRGHRSTLMGVPNITLLDAFEMDGRKGQGYGFSHLRLAVHEHRPDVVLVYNDINVVARVVDALQGVSGVPVMAYIDLVYSGMRPACVAALNRCASVVGYSPRWAIHLANQGVTVPVYHAGHGVDRDVIYPIPIRLARTIFGLDAEDFIVLNMNTNIVRKRWDVCLGAWALVVADYYANGGAFPKLVINANLTGAWDLLHVFALELGEVGVEVPTGMKHIVPVSSGHTLSDFHVNALYNAADVGVSVGDGEGFGLCAFEQSSVGRPVVASAVGGHLDNLRPEAVTLVPSACRYHVDGSRIDGGGVGEIVAAATVAEALLSLKHNRAGAVRKARLAAEHTAPGWNVAVSDMHHAISTTLAGVVRSEPAPAPELHAPSPRNVLELENIAHSLREAIAKIK